MSCSSLRFAAFAIVASATSLSAQAPRTARDSVVATVTEFFRAMTARDTAAANRVQISEGVWFAVRTQGDSAVVSARGADAFVRQLATMKDTLVERMWKPTVQIHGPIANVWAEYDFHRNGKFSHCGVDAFSLIRTRAGWKIATITYTTEPTGCAPSPLGPVR